MDVIMTVRYTAPADALARRYGAMSWVRGRSVASLPELRWAWGETGEVHQRSLVVFFGKTGYGKSTTLNRLIGEERFASSAVESCTRDCQCADYELEDGALLSLVDLPGVAEDFEVDDAYIRTYERFLDYAQVVVYVLRADQRDLSIDTRLLARLRQAPARPRILYALNFCDKLEPMSRAWPFRPDAAQQAVIQLKCEWAARELGVPLADVVPYSAEGEWALDELMTRIGEGLSESGVFIKGGAVLPYPERPVI